MQTAPGRPLQGSQPQKGHHPAGPAEHERLPPSRRLPGRPLLERRV